jgi:hypothetical protein
MQVGHAHFQLYSIVLKNISQVRITGSTFPCIFRIEVQTSPCQGGRFGPEQVAVINRTEWHAGSDSDIRRDIFYSSLWVNNGGHGIWAVLNSAKIIGTEFTSEVGTTENERKCRIRH